MSLAAKDMYSSNQSASIISNKRSCRSCCSRLDDGFRCSVPSACVLAAVAYSPIASEPACPCRKSSFQYRATGDPASYQSNDGAPGPSACPRQRYGRKAMIDSSRRTVLTTGAAATATAAAPQVFAQTPQTSAPQGAPAGAKTGYYEKGNIRIRYTEIGTGFPLLATPG